MNKLRVVTLFSGYDSQCLGLDRLHKNYQLAEKAHGKKILMWLYTVLNL